MCGHDVDVIPVPCDLYDECDDIISHMCWEDLSFYRTNNLRIRIEWHSTFAYWHFEWKAAYKRIMIEYGPDAMDYSISGLFDFLTDLGVSCVYV